MKRAKGLTFFIAAVLILAFAYTAFFGVGYYYGDIRFTTLKGIGDISAGSDLGTRAKVVFEPEDDAEYTAEQLDELKEVMLVRLTNIAYHIDNSYVDTVRGVAVFDLALKAEEDKYDFGLAMDNLTTRARFTVRKAAGEDINPSDESNVIFDNSVIESATAVYASETDVKIQITLNDEGKQIWWDNTTLLLGKTVSAWIDSSHALDFTIDKIVDRGVVEFTSDRYTAQELSALAYTINYGCLPMETQHSSTVFVNSSAGENAVNTAALCLGIAIAVICVILIIRYRIAGVAASLAVIGVAAFIAALMSGYVSTINNRTVEIGGILGIGSSLLAVLAIALGAAEAVKSGLLDGNSLDNSVRSGLKRSVTPLIDGSVALLLGGFIISGAWGLSAGISTGVIRPILTLLGDIAGVQTSSLGTVLLVCCIACPLMCLIAALMCRSASKASYMRNPFLFGGKR